MKNFNCKEANFFGRMKNILLRTIFYLYLLAIVFLHYLVQLFPLALEADSIPASRLGDKHDSGSRG